MQNDNKNNTKPPLIKVEGIEIENDTQYKLQQKLTVKLVPLTWAKVLPETM